MRSNGCLWTRGVNLTTSPDSIGADVVKQKASLCEGIHIVDSLRANPKGCKKVAGGRSVAETTGKVGSNDRTLKGCQTSQQVLLIKFDTRRVEKLSQFINI